MKAKKALSNTVIHLVLIIIGLFFLLPFLWMLSTALKSNTEIFATPPVWLPRPPQWQNFAKALDVIPFFKYMGNTTFIAVMDVLGTILICPMIAYGLSRLEWKGRDALFFITIAVMMIPQEVTMVPTFILFNRLNLVGTYIPLFIQSFFGRPFMIFLLRQFFMNLPRDLEDAARVDGAPEILIYGRIVLPLVVPGLLTVGLFRFMAVFTDKRADYTPWTNGMGNVTQLPVQEGQDANFWTEFKDYYGSAQEIPLLGWAFDSTPVDNEMSALANVAAEYALALSTGTVDPAEKLPEFLDKLEANGIDKVVEEANNQVKAFMDAKGA